VARSDAEDLDSVECLMTLTRPHRMAQGAGAQSWLYRGQVDGRKPLVAAAGRLCGMSADAAGADQDLRIFDTWRQRAPFYERSIPPNDWEALAVAAHHGLATRMLDWSLNPLVALFFAVCGAGLCEAGRDGALYLFRVGAIVDPERDKLGAVQHLCVFFPAGRTHRVIRQRGAFTYHPAPSRPLEEDAEVADGQLLKYRVPQRAKDGIRKDLDLIGINQEMLFPDLEGYSQHLNWLSEAAQRERTRGSQASR
jgi:hypothetical protein